MTQVKQFYALLFLALFVLQGCGTLGYTNVDTTRKAIVVATAEVRAANMLLQDLIDTGSISQSDARKALNSLQSAKNRLQAGLNAIDVAGDSAMGENNLHRANVALSVALNLLAPLVEN